MERKVKSLEEISDEINEQLGVFKKFERKSGFYPITRHYFHSSTGRILYNKDYDLVSEKLHRDYHVRNLQGVTTAFFKSKRGYKTKLDNKKEHADHYGEYIAFLILKQLGKKVCKSDLGEFEIVFPFNKKVKTIEGVLSHPEFDELKGESFREFSTIIDDYRNTYPKKYQALIGDSNPLIEANYTNVEVILKVIEEYCKKNDQEHKLPQIRKDFFDMLIFDLKFANRDRHEGNFGLKVSDTGEIDFYPLFDNEQILGMQLEKNTASRYLDDKQAYQRLKKEDLTSYIGIPGKPQHVESDRLLLYLLENYYDETKDSLDDIGRYSLNDLEEVLEVCPGLSTAHKDLAKKVFIDREKEINDVINEFQKNKQQNTTNKNKLVDEGPGL